jgi:3',5'-cyclic AMP phosphodiesterase CpdA
VGSPIRIAHISDLHCGSRYHIPSLATRVVDELNQLCPDAVVVTGDLTDMGYAPEMRSASRLLGRIECERKLVLLGNHDARNVGDELFEGLFGARNSMLAFDRVRVLGVDSSEPDLDSGHVGRTNYNWIEQQFADPDEFKVLAIHHHLVPVPGTGRERNVVRDAGDLLRVLASNGTDLVLCGHKHVPNVWRLEDMLVVNAGTCCTHRLRGTVRPSYNVIEVHGHDRVRVLLKEPYRDAEVVADMEAHQRSCRWSASTTMPEDGDEW